MYVPHSSDALSTFAEVLNQEINLFSLSRNKTKLMLAMVIYTRVKAQMNGGTGSIVGKTREGQ